MCGCFREECGVGLFLMCGCWVEVWMLDEMFSVVLMFEYLFDRCLFVC